MAEWREKIFPALLDRVYSGSTAASNTTFNWRITKCASQKYS